MAAAWLFASARPVHKHGNLISIATFGTIVGPASAARCRDAVVISVVWSAQFFLAGLPLYWAVLLIVGGAGALVAAYFTLHHVASRIDRFSQIIFGRQLPGRSFWKLLSMAVFSGAARAKAPSRKCCQTRIPTSYLPSRAKNSVYFCLIIVGLFAFIVLRGFARALQETDLFILLATAGLLVQFGLQAVINMGSTLRLLPTKGMTLPFVSYGGSSLIAMGLCIGFLLALTRAGAGHSDDQQPAYHAAAGGTGGHIFPAIAVAEALIREATLYR